MEFRNHTLDNGLDIIAECSDSAYSMAMAFYVNTGSRDETAAVAGVSHFLEHMVFKGTPNRSAADVNRQLDEIGSQSNAFTSEEHTVYYAAVLPDYQSQALELLADIMRPSLRQEDFDTEKKVIIEEIRKYDDQPPYGAHERCMANYFGTHPLGQSVLGTVDSVSAMTRDAMMGYFEQRYSPGNIKLVATGNVDFDQLVVQAEQHCGKWKSFDTARQPHPVPANQGIDVIARESATQQYLIQISSAPSATDDLRFAHRLMTTIFGDEGGSRLFWELVDTGMAEYAVTGNYEYDGAGVTMGFFSCSPDSATEIMERVKSLQETIQANGVTEDELEMAKSKLCSQLVRRAERPANRLFAVGNNWAQRGCYRSISDVVDSFRSVTTADIAKTLAQHPLTETASVLAGPLQSI